MIILAGGMVALAGGGGLAVDAVAWFLWKRQLQQAVDSGALAGAHAQSQGRNVTTAAQRDIDGNADTAVTVETISAPPKSGAYTANTSAVEVVATTSRTLPFSSLFLAKPPVIRARSVAAAIGDGEHCVIALAGDGVGVNVKGTASVELGCGIAANSQGAQAIYLEGSSYLNGSPLSTVGGIDAAASNTANGTDLRPYGSPVADPIAPRNLTVPATPSACTATSLEAPPNRLTTLLPGRYCGGLALKGEVVLLPGVYIMDQGVFSIASQANVIGEGVTIILTGSSPSNIASLNFAGGADIDLRAPTALESPTWKNILIFQDPRGTSNLSSVSGGSGMDMEGVIYMPGGNLSFTGGSGQRADCLLLVANRVTLGGNTAIKNSCASDYDDLSLSAFRIRVVE